MFYHLYIVDRASTRRRRAVDEQYIESTDLARSKTFDQSEIEAIPVENGGKQESKWEAI